MATMATERAAITRQEGWFLRIVLDRCTLENLFMFAAAVTCTATSQCRYTFATCKDTANYTKGTRNFDFCTRGSNVAGALPYLTAVGGALPTEINQKEFKTSRGKLSFKLSADTALKLSDPDKQFDAAKLSNATDTGNYWPNFWKRNPAYRGRRAELYYGFIGVDPSSWELKFRGIIENVEYSDKDCQIEAIDLLWSCATQKTPAEIPAEILVNDNPLTSGATSVTLTDGVSSPYTPSTHFETPDYNSGASTTNQYRYVKIENEIIAYNQLDDVNGQLDGCIRGVMGTTAAEHAQGTAIKQVAYWGDTDATDSAWSDVAGLPADHIFMDLLVNLGGVSGSYITTDTGPATQVDGAQLATATTINVSDGADLPSEGIVKIASEFIRYTGNTGTALTGCKRGCYGTTAAALSDNADIDPVCFTTDMGNWMQGFRYKGRFENSTKVKDRINTLRACTMLDLWVNESGNVEGRIQKPAFYSGTPPTYTDADMRVGTRSLDRNEAQRITRARVIYNGSKVDPGKDIANYSGRSVYINATSESSDSYNEERGSDLYCEWIYRANEADWLAAHYFLANQEARPIMQFTLEEKDENTVEVADLIYLTVPEIVDEDGTEKTRLFMIIRKKVKGGGEVEFKAIDSGFAEQRYCLISSDADTYDATSADKNIYGWISDASNFLGAANDDTYRIY